MKFAKNTNQFHLSYKSLFDTFPFQLLL